MARQTRKPKMTRPAAGRLGRKGGGSLGEKVYGLIKREIHTCVLAPGSAFSEAQLSERYGVSKAPVRWALAALSQERLVISNPRQGYTVTPVTIQSVRELFGIREILEPAAARAAAGRTDVRRLERLDAEVSKGYTVGNADSQSRFFEANKEFHVEIARAAGNERLATLIESTWGEMERIFFLGLGIPKATRFMAPDHRKLIDCLAAGKAEEAAQITAEHITNSKTMILDVILGSAIIQQANIAAKVA
jgi:DNA-binding GntR family transcriptional regulator